MPDPERLAPTPPRTLIARGSVVALSALLASPPLLFWLEFTWRYRALDPLLVWSFGTSVAWLVLLHAVVRRPFWLHVALAPLYLATTADLFLVLHFDARLTSSYLTIVLTDYSDAGEFTRAFASEIALALVPVALLYGFGLRAIRHVRSERRPAVAWIAAALVVAGYAIPLVRQARGVPISGAIRDVLAHDYSSPVGVLSQTGVTVANLLETRANVSARDAFSFGASRKDVAPGEEELFVVVIGESARPDRWSLGGYRRDTTPRLRTVPNLVWFPDVIATAPHTARAVPSMLSLSPITDWTAIESSRSIVSAFREVGFDAEWLSTQEVSAFGGIVYQIAAEARTIRFFDRQLDDALSGVVRDLLATPKSLGKLLIVLQTRGNHFGTTKYPPEFRRWPDSGGGRRADVDNAYDNGILFTDSVLADIIEAVRARRSKAVVFYESDHGENLFDVGQLLGHGIGNRYDLHTTAFFWYSDEVAAASPAKIARAREHATARLSHANLAHSILDLAGIEANGLDLSRSYFSERFREAPRMYWAKGVLREYEEPRVGMTVERR